MLRSYLTRFCFDSGRFDKLWLHWVWLIRFGFERFAVTRLGLMGFWYDHVWFDTESSLTRCCCDEVDFIRFGLIGFVLDEIWFDLVLVLITCRLIMCSLIRFGLSDLVSTNFSLIMVCLILCGMN